MFKKIASNTIFQVVSKIISAIIALFLIKILTNYLPKDLYGLYGVVYDYTGIFVFLADLWLYAITIKEISQNKEKQASIVGNVMSLRLILWVWILFISLFIACFLDGYNSPLALWAIFISSLFTIVQLMNSSILALLQANMKMEIPAFTFIFWKLVNIALVGGLAYYFFPERYTDEYGFFLPFVWIFWVATIGVIVNTILNYWYARRIAAFDFAFDWKYIKYIFKISLPYGIALFLSVLYFKIDVILLPILEGEEMGKLSVAYYKLPMKITEVIMVMAGFYMSSILPTLSTFYKNKQQKQLSDLISVSFQLLFTFSMFVFIMGVLFREQIIIIMANDSFIYNNLPYNSADAFLIVFFVILFYFISVVFIYALMASDNQKSLLKINIAVTLVNIIWNIIMIPKMSFIGAGIVTIISQILLFICTFYTAKKKLNIVLPYRAIVRNTLYWAFVFVLGYYLLIHYSVGLYFDFFVYGAILGLLYLGYVLFEYKRARALYRKNS